MEQRIYVASLSAYNAGILHGEWITLNGKTREEVLYEISLMLIKSTGDRPAEEWAIHDHEGFAPYEVSEYADISELCDLVAAVEEHGRQILALVDHLSLDAEAAVRYHEDNYQGEWHSLSEWAEDWLEQTGSLSELHDNLKHYFDYESFARDCEMGGDIFTLDTGDGTIWVYGNR